MLTPTPPVTAYNAHQLIRLLQHRPELIHFAGAAHRDADALAVCQEWLDDPTATVHDLRARARARCEAQRLASIDAMAGDPDDCDPRGMFIRRPELSEATWPAYQAEYLASYELRCAARGVRS